MLKLHPEIIMRNGKKTSVVLPYKEFKALQDRLQDAEDLLALEVAKKAEGRKRSIPLAKVKKDLGF
jgi:PHD/YefM family antitoxin component YafN of YafNO toxin-antitoxin module